MPDFIINEKSLSSAWTIAEKFDSKGRIVDRKGNAVDGRQVDCQYRLTGKKERMYTFWERLGRAVLGVFCVVGSGGLALKAKCVAKLFTKQKKCIRFGELIGPPKPPKKGCPLSKGMPEDEYFQKFIDAYESGSLKPDKVYTSQDGHTVFTLSEVPGYIFKKQLDAEKRYDLMLKAHEVCRSNQLRLLKIPHAKLLGSYIVEEKFELGGASVLEEEFGKYSSSITETMRQLAVFICKTGFTDVTWRNIPVLAKSGDKLGLKSIALIDLEEVDPNEENAAIGLFGIPDENGFSIPHRRGLIGCVSEAQFKLIQKVAEKELPDYAYLFDESAERRKKELEEQRNLQRFYEKWGIKTGNEPITADAALADEERIVLEAINTMIQGSSDQDSIKRRRRKVLKESCVESIKSLIKKGYLFKMENYNGGLVVQA